jgi:hypothetical protein
MGCTSPPGDATDAGIDARTAIDGGADGSRDVGADVSSSDAAHDATASDAGMTDANLSDMGASDAGVDATTSDAGSDASASDAGVDAQPSIDAGTDMGTDAGVDAGSDAGVDAGSDAGVDSGNDVGVDAAPQCTASNPCSHQTCVGGMCLGVCAPGELNCMNNTPQHCGPAGTWVNDTPCAQPTPMCSGGSCVCTQTTCGSTCTTLDTTSHCGSCNTVCTANHATAPTCSGTTCSYTCNTGASDCNGATAPNADGCECATPSCCGTSCQNTHSDGLGQSYYDCNPLSTHNTSQALEACTAYAQSTGHSASNCSDQWQCPAEGNATMVCYSTTGGATCSTFCWSYSGTSAGWVTSCADCTASVGTWN